MADVENLKKKIFGNNFKDKIYEDDFHETNEGRCLYCGVVLSQKSKEYCSDVCQEKDSVWRFDNY